MKVVNMRNCNPPFGQMGDVRIDRKTKWGNPFPLLNDTPFLRNMVIQQYELWIRQQIQDGILNIDELMAATRLGCWCKPKPCHGDILIKILREKYGSTQSKLIGD